MLCPYQPAGPIIQIKNKVFKVGRGKQEVDHTVCQAAYGKKVLGTISKVQFQLEYDDDHLYIRDMSTNGTYVNKEKLVRGERRPLDHNDVIAMSIDFSKHFLFIKNTANEFPPEITQKFSMSKLLGSGACGNVYLGIRKSDSKQFAIKNVKKEHASALSDINIANKNAILNEINLLNGIDHPNIIKLEEVIETEGNIYMVLELADGGEVFDEVVKKIRLHEPYAKSIFYQTLCAIDYLHSNNIAHRDLKPENLLLLTPPHLEKLLDTKEKKNTEGWVVKVSDFGLSKLVDPTKKFDMRTFCGTLLYLAPEVISTRINAGQCYNEKIDMWSLGVLLYVLLAGCQPFFDSREDTDLTLVQQINGGIYDLVKMEVWKNVSEDAKDLIRRLLVVDPIQRLSAAAALKHPWLQDEEMKAKVHYLRTEKAPQFKKPAKESAKRPEPSTEETGEGTSSSACKRQRH